MQGACRIHHRIDGRFSCDFAPFKRWLSTADVDREGTHRHDKKTGFRRVVGSLDLRGPEGMLKAGLRLGSNSSMGGSMSQRIIHRNILESSWNARFVAFFWAFLATIFLLSLWS